MTETTTGPAIDEANEEEATQLIAVGDALTGTTMVEIDTATGEVLGIHDAPSETAEVAHLCEWIGPRLTGARARQKALELEKAEWIKRINAQYDPLINREKSFIAYLLTFWREPLRLYAADALRNAKTKSVKLGLIKLGFKMSRQRIEVTDESKALSWCLINSQEAVKTTRSILVSKIDVDKIREQIEAETLESPEDVGLSVIEPADVFYVE